MKKSKVLTYVVFCFALSFGNTNFSQSSDEVINDISWAANSKDRLNDLTEKLKQITSDQSLTEEEKSNKLQETNEELLSLIEEIEVKNTEIKRYKFDTKTPINNTPIVTQLSKSDTRHKPSNAERNIAMERLNKAEERLHNQKINGKISESDYLEKLDRVLRAKMQITCI